jgi:hypothetical protein
MRIVKKEFFKMMKNRIFVCGTMAMALAAVFTFAGCDDSLPEDPGPTTVTFTLAKVGTNGFSITVDGADWEYADGDFTNSVARDAARKLLDFGSLSVTDNDDNSVNNDQYDCFDYTIAGKVITAALKSGYSSVSGTLKFPDHGLGENSRGYTNVLPEYFWDEGADQGGGKGYNIFIGKPETGITF